MSPENPKIKRELKYHTTSETTSYFNQLVRKKGQSIRRIAFPKYSDPLTKRGQIPNGVKVKLASRCFPCNLNIKLKETLLQLGEKIWVVYPQKRSRIKKISKLLEQSHIPLHLFEVITMKMLKTMWFKKKKAKQCFRKKRRKLQKLASISNTWLQIKGIKILMKHQWST